MPAQFEQAELLKKQYTDKFVVVKQGVPELRRFDGLTGVVKTVNMSGRALVLFDGPADIGWYDIDPAFLTVVDAPAPKKKAEEKPAKESPAAKSAPAAKPAAAAGEKKASPLDLIRQQGAGGAKPAAAPAAGGAKLSPLDLVRQQGAAKASGAASAPASAAAPAASGEGKKLSPIEMIRQQQAAKSGEVPQATAAPAAVETTPAPTPVAEAPKPAVPAAADGKKLSLIEQIRMQGAFKGNK